MTNYEKQFQQARDVCGTPFKEFVDFFNKYSREEARVLDLGCGQGRDALFIARMGHHVLGVDISNTGVLQMLEDAERESLKILGLTADVVEYVPEGGYDVVLLDRVLHMFKHDHERIKILEKVSIATNSGGYILIADIPKHHAQIRSFFEQQPGNWKTIKDRKGIIFMQKP